MCALNIALNNVSLRLVSLSLHQIIRSLTPLLTMLLEWMLVRGDGSGRGSWMRRAGLGVVMSGLVTGIVLSVLGERGGAGGGVLGENGGGKQGESASTPPSGNHITAGGSHLPYHLGPSTWPVVVTAMGAGVSAFKGVFTGILLKRRRGREYSPLQLLLLTAPMAAVLCAGVGLLLGG